MSDSLRNRIRSRIHKPSGKKDSSRKHPTYVDEEFFDIGDNVSIGSDISERGSMGSMRTGDMDENHVKRSGSFDKTVFEEQLNLLQEQLVSVMIENQALSQQVEEYKAAAKRESSRPRDGHFKKKPSNDSVSGVIKKTHGKDQHSNMQGEEIAVLPAESQTGERRSRLDTVVERLVERFYQIVEDFTEITKPEKPKLESEPQLAVKRLKENIKRFMTGIKPYMDTFKGFNNLMTWKSPSYTIIVLCIYMYTVWKGWFIPFLVFLAVVRMAVNYLHFKNFSFPFSYLDPGETEKESEDVTLGLSDKFNLVLQVATKVQNGLGTAADSLEKVKNLVTWRHHEAARRLFSGLCFMLVISVILPTSMFWTFLGLGFGVKIFVINPIYARYPRVKKRYDRNAKLWAALPTDAQYNKDFVSEEMNKFIVIPKSASEQEMLFQQSLSDSESDEDESCKSVEFRELFSLPPTECPLTGWMRGRRALLVGRDKSVFNLISKKRGKLYLTNSFLCFAREKMPSPRNIVIPLQDIIHIDRVKVTHRLPGKGMALQIVMSSEGKNKVLVFGAIIGRDEAADAIERAMENIHKLKQTEVSSRRSWSSDSSASKISNFTFGPFYEDSDSFSD